MKLLFKAAIANRRHMALLGITLVAMLLLTLASQAEMLSLGVIAQTGPDFLTLFGQKEELSLQQVQERWSEIARGSEVITREMANRYLSEQGHISLVARASLFLQKHFNTSHNLTRLAFFLVFVALFKAITLFCQRYFTQLVSIRVSRDLRQRYFEHIQALPMSFHQDHSTGSLSSRVLADAAGIASALNSLLLNYIQTPFAAISTLIGCFLISWKLSLIIFVGFPLIVLPIVVLAKKVKQIAQLMQKNQEGFATVLLDFLSGISTVKVFAMERFSQKKYKEKNFEMAKLEERSARYGVASRPLLHAVSSLFFATVILSGFYYFAMPPADLLVFCGLLYIFYEPIKKFAEENHNIYRGVAAAERMEQILGQHSCLVENKEALEWRSFKQEIEFRNVSFRYKEEWVLKDINLKVKKGQMVALVGPTGAGKSTIVQLLPRLYEVTTGQILIDGVSIDKFKISSLRENIAYVLQKPFLFFDTIHENIAFGRPYSREAVVRAAKRAHANDFIEQQGLGYDHQLAEGGKNLSGGQQQRLAIARALVKQAPILILDEATSALDAISEQHIKEALFELKGEITQIIIAHRFSTIEYADHIVYIDKGKVIAEGSKNELLASCEDFARMWRMMHSHQQTSP